MGRIASLYVKLLFLILKVPITHNSNRQQSDIFFFFSEKIRCVISRELSARQSVHMKSSALFSLLIKNQFLRMLSAKILHVNLWFNMKYSSKLTYFTIL